MNEIFLKESIKELLKEKNAVLLAHNYQRDEVQEIADYTGDSLGLSIQAKNTNADIIIFCGVYFMAETAAILSPEKTVILPRMDAGCPMADMITASDIIERKAAFKNCTVVCYVNSTAEVKAQSDICCTSANAVSVVESIKSPSVFMVPDKNLAKYTVKFSKKEITWWNGYCHVHNDLRVEDVVEAKEKFPNSLFVAHPECKPEVLLYADHVCSTSGMYAYVKESAHNEFIIGTETGILYRLKNENPHKTFHIASPNLICPNMKITRLLDVYTSLVKMQNIVTVKQEIREKAKESLDKMLAVPRDL